MNSSRKVYLLTFVTYALIHSVRTGWSYIKTYSQRQLNFTTRFLGELDMTVLICLAISLKTLGWLGDRIGHLNFLLIGMIYLALMFMLMGVLQLVGVMQHWPYVLLYAMVGIASCSGWPTCLYMVSLKYPPKENGFKLCLWNGCSQFGDFIALSLGYLLIEIIKAKPQSLILTISGLLLLMAAINWFFLDVPKQEKNVTTEQNQDVPGSKVYKFLRQISVAGDKVPDPNIEVPRTKKSSKTKVNFLNVWLLPSVASYVLCYACLKSVNAIIMSWLIFYLFSIGLHKYSSTITVSWSMSLFLGSLIMGYYNNSVNKLGLIVPLLFTAFIFAYLGVEYERNSQFHYLSMMIISGLCFGGPFGLIGSKITLLLGRNPKIKNREGAVGAIISVMEGFGQFAGAFFVLIVPYLGLKNLLYLPSLLCVISGAILFYLHRKEIDDQQKDKFRIREEELKAQARANFKGISV